MAVAENKLTQNIKNVSKEKLRWCIFPFIQLPSHILSSWIQVWKIFSAHAKQQWSNHAVPVSSLKRLKKCTICLICWRQISKIIAIKPSFAFVPFTRIFIWWLFFLLNQIYRFLTLLFKIKMVYFFHQFTNSDQNVWFILSFFC